MLECWSRQRQVDQIMSLSKSAHLLREHPPCKRPHNLCTSCVRARAFVGSALQSPSSPRALRRFAAMRPQAQSVLGVPPLALSVLHSKLPHVKVLRAVRPHRRRHKRIVCRAGCDKLTSTRFKPPPLGRLSLLRRLARERRPRQRLWCWSWR